jgi:hypothetical protein
MLSPHATWDSRHLHILNGRKKLNHAEVGKTKDSSGPLVIGAQMDHTNSYSHGITWLHGIIDRVEI